MADTFTTEGRFTLQEVGQNNNLWGGINNSGVVQLINDSIFGRVAVSVEVGDVTLTTVDGATDQARFAIVAATGNPGQARTITVPTLSKLYIVSNETDPGFDVTVKTAAGTGVVVPAGDRAHLIVDAALDEVFPVGIAGIPPLADDSNKLVGVDGNLYARLDQGNQFSGGASASQEAIISASDATPTPDGSLSNVFLYTPTVGFTFQTPINPLNAWTFQVAIQVAGGGGGSFGAGYIFPGGITPTIPGTIGWKGLLSAQYHPVNDEYWCVLAEDFS